MAFHASSKGHGARQRGSKGRPKEPGSLPLSATPPMPRTRNSKPTEEVVQRKTMILREHQVDFGLLPAMTTGDLQKNDLVIYSKVPRADTAISFAT